MVDGVNRFVLAFVGLVAAVASGLGLLLAEGTLEWDQPSEIYERLADDAVANEAVWGGVAIAGGVLLALLGLAWAWRQLVGRSDGTGLGTTALVRTPKGRTTVEPVALARAVAADLATVPGVTNSRVRLLDLSPQPHLVAVLSLEDDAQMAAVREAAEAPFDRLCRALESPNLSADIRFRPTGKERSRVI